MKTLEEIFKGYKITETKINAPSFFSIVKVKTASGEVIAKINLEGLQDSIAMFGEETVSKVLSKCIVESNMY